MPLRCYTPSSADTASSSSNPTERTASQLDTELLDDLRTAFRNARDRKDALFHLRQVFRDMPTLNRWHAEAKRVALRSAEALLLQTVVRGPDGGASRFGGFMRLVTYLGTADAEALGRLLVESDPPHEALSELREIALDGGQSYPLLERLKAVCQSAREWEESNRLNGNT